MKHLSLFLAWLVAVVATFASLYLSEYLFLKPCDLCWYQRICMFPLVIILGRGSWRGDFESVSYAIPFAFIGLILALYQMMMQDFFHFDPIGLCSFAHECTHRQIMHFMGFSVPVTVLSSIAFFIVFILLLFARKSERIDRL